MQTGNIIDVTGQNPPPLINSVSIATGGGQPVPLADSPATRSPWAADTPGFQGPQAVTRLTTGSQVSRDWGAR
ncbi:MAG: hypothetical protein EXR62_18365 [Chloroflexi bacterium]|nr:hypothetical protein [Chloroflexota bacterium]